MARRTRSQRFQHVANDEAGGDILADIIGAAESEGRSPQSDSYLATISLYGKRFTNWLDSIGGSLNELAAVAPRDAHNNPIMSSYVILRYTDHVSNTSPTIKQRSLGDHVSGLRAWLKTQGWSTVNIERGTPGGKRITNRWRNHQHNEADIVRRARPVGVDDLAVFVQTLDDNPMCWTELMVEAMRTWLLVVWAASLRGGEAVYELKWGWFHDTGGRLELRLPGGRVLKHQNDAHTLAIPAHPTNSKLCAVTQLRTWRELCERHGVRTDDDALVLPAIRAQRAGTNSAVMEQAIFDRFAGRDFDDNPIEHAVETAAAAGATGDDLRTVRADAEKRHYQIWKKRWLVLCRHAGWESRHQFESVGTHGNRRGSAQTARNGGADIIVISQRLRHGTTRTTGVYLDRQLQDTRSLFTPAGGDINSATVNDFDDVLNTDVEGGGNGCGISFNGTRCARQPNGHAVVDGQDVAVCPAHRQRLLHGVAGDQLRAPIRKHHVGGPCQITQNGHTCGRTFGHHITIDGEPTAACSAHAARARRGATGDRLTAPIREPRSRM